MCVRWFLLLTPLLFSCEHPRCPPPLCLPALLFLLLLLLFLVLHLLLLLLLLLLLCYCYC